MDKSALSQGSAAVMRLVDRIWSYPILTIDQNQITAGSIIIGLILLVGGYALSRRISRRIAQRAFGSLERSIQHTLETVLFYILVVMSSLFALKMANIPLTVFTLVGGALAIGVGFGSQNLVKNFISGLILFVERPIKVGDFVEIDKEFCQVIHIGMRSTHVLNYGNRNIIVPNSTFLETNIINWTHNDSFVKVMITVGVVYGSPTRKVEQILIEAAKMEPRVLSHKKPEVIFHHFGDNSLDFELYFWIQLKDLMDRKHIESSIRFNVDEVCRREGIVIAFPQRDVHLYTSKPIAVEVQTKGPTV